MKSRKFWENFILAAIVLVIIQTFLDDFSVYRHWSVRTRNILLCTALLFDIIFSVEFIVRSYLAGKSGSVTGYWLYGRGWIDFMSSIPLLLLNSGPSVLLLALGTGEEGALSIGVLNVLKVVKAIRVTRILRLIRIIKIFGKIQNAESPMAQHHTSTIATTAVFTIICVLMTFSLATQTPHEMSIKKMESAYNNDIKAIISNGRGEGRATKDIINMMFSGDPAILRADYKDSTVLSNIDEKELDEYYGIHDYMIIENRGISLCVSIADINKQDAYNNILHFFIIVITVISFMVVYTRHFAQNISDIIHVMNQGFRKRSYNFQVKIKDEFIDEEVFRLAKFYNDTYLPAKSRKLQNEEGKKKPNISMDFLKDFKSE